ncbi:MAG: endonuclease/exonuclease/phosphatase family protein [Myxococcota bacterium]
MAYRFGALVLCAALACGDDSAPPIDFRIDLNFPEVGPDAPDVPEMGAELGRDLRVPDRAVPFSVMTWNVENFFDSRNDPDTGDEVFSNLVVEQKIANIAEVIRAADPDFIALQEVENEPLVARLVNDGLSGMGYENFGLMDSFDGRGIDVAYISRNPVNAVVSQLGERFDGPDGPQFFTRDALEVFVDVGGTEVLVMTSHFISQASSGSDGRRLGEAQQVQDILRRRVGAVPRVLFVADLNDTPDSPTYDAIVNGGVLTDHTLQIPSSDRWTFIFRGREQQLDYAFGSVTMVSELQRVEIPRGASVERTSDHYPVVARFVINP